MSGYVYFLRCGDRVKIGHSVYPDARLAAVQSWCPYHLELVASIKGDKKLERNIQNCFADHHSHNEWFVLGTRLSDFLKAINSGVPLHQAIDLSDTRGNVLGQIQKATREKNGTTLNRPACRSTRSQEQAA